MKKHSLSFLALLQLACTPVGSTGEPTGGSTGTVVDGGVVAPDGGSTGTGQVSTWRDQRLPGHLLVERMSQAPNFGPWLSYSYDLQTGERQQLPYSMIGEPDDNWGATGDTVWRFEQRKSLITFFAWPAMTVVRAVTLPKEVFSVSLELSRDGQYLLATWADVEHGESTTDRQLTIFDATTGAVVEHGSMQPPGYGTTHSATWLPDGRYLYIVGRQLYVTTPKQPGETVLFELTGLPSNDLSTITSASLRVSPDGRKLALSWLEPRNNSNDTNVWVVDLSGANLHRLSAAPSPGDALSFHTAAPTWSPDGAFVAMIRFMDGATTAAVYPDTPFSGERIIGTTGCLSQVFVMPVDTVDAALTWPLWDDRYGVKVRNATGSGGRWLSNCAGSIAWVR